MTTTSVWVLQPFHYAFFTHGLLAVVLAGGACGAAGTYVVLRRMSYIGHGLAHSILGGAVLSYVMHWNFYIGAGLWGSLSAMLIQFLSRQRHVTADSATATVTMASFAGGVALISRMHRFTQSFEAVLFGNVLGVRREDLFVLAGVALFVAFAIFWAYRPLLFVAFDPEVARLHGIHMRWIDSLLSVTLAVVLIAALNVLGATLVAAILVIPAAAARLLTDSFSRMLWLATGIGILAGVIGMYVSYYTDIASGATIALSAAALYGLAFTASLLRSVRDVRSV